MNYMCKDCAAFKWHTKEELRNQQASINWHAQCGIQWDDSLIMLDGKCRRHPQALEKWHTDGCFEFIAKETE